MSVIGDPSRFAIEYDLDKSHGGAWMFGRICYWCGGQCVGDFDLGTSLRDVLFQLDQIVKNKSNRKSDRFRALPAHHVFRILDGALFGAVDLNNADVADDEQWALLNIIPPVDVFDHWKAFVVGDDKSSRIIFASDPYQEIREVLLRPGELDGVLCEVRSALDEIYQSEKDVSHGHG